MKILIIVAMTSELEGFLKIKDFEIKSAVPQILDMIYENDDETLICEGLSTLKQFDALAYTDKDEILSNLKNETIKAIVKSYYS